MDTTVTQDPARLIFHVHHAISALELQSATYPIMRMIVERAAREIADEFLRRHRSEILAALDPVAVANLAVAQAAAGLMATIGQNRK